MDTENLILSALSLGDMALLAPHLQLVDLTRDQRLERRGRVVESVYFIERGMACASADREGHGVEVGMIGREGLVGVAGLLDATHNMNDVQVLAAGAARRASVGTVRDLMNESVSLRKEILGYVLTFLFQVMREAQTNARATLDARLARWILMMHDRVSGDDLLLTHDRLAVMMGVRRAGVSVAAKKLERQGAISLQRGTIVVRDRERLEDSSGGAYGAADRPAATPG